MRGWRRSAVVASLVGFAAFPLAAQDAPPAKAQSTATPKAGSLSAADSKFIHEAAAGGMAEVELGRLAADKASSPDVKQFGQRMIDDHGKANDELKSLASQKGVTLPPSPDAAQKATQARLTKLSGDAFDRAYMQDMVKDHDKDVAAFKRASTMAADADLKAWAAKTLPTLEEHQKQAKSINAKLGPAGGASKGARGEDE
jgi:putative membrane protein